MTEDPRHDGEFLALLKPERRAGVAQIVEPLAGEAGGGSDAWKRCLTLLPSKERPSGDAIQSHMTMVVLDAACYYSPWP